MSLDVARWGMARAMGEICSHRGVVVW
jgi:hypothetical protein